MLQLVYSYRHKVTFVDYTGVLFYLEAWYGTLGLLQDSPLAPRKHSRLTKTNRQQNKIRNS